MVTIFNTNFIGNDSVFLESVNSTNDFLKQLVSKKTLNEGFVVTASYQMNGKGQMGSHWLASKDLNYLGSILLYPHFIPITDFFKLNQMVSLACIEALNGYLSDHNHSGELKVKWPNDIYLNQKKIGGILIENSVLQTTIQQSIIGIGINLFEPSFPASIPNATSLALQFPNTPWDDTFKHRLYHAIEKYYLKVKNRQNLKQEYLNNLLFMNLSRNFKDASGPFSGEIIDVEESGLLLIKDQQENIRKYGFKEVEFLF